MNILEFRQVTLSQPVNNKYLNYRKKCYHAWYYTNGSYWQDDSGQVTQRSWIDLYEEFLPFTEKTGPLVSMFLDDHKQCFDDHKLTLLNDQFPPDFQGDSQRRNQWEREEFDLLKKIAATVAKNMQKYEEMAEVKHG